MKDWPFNNHDGYFEAAGRIHGGVMRFQSEWPVLEKLDADIAFIGNGFSIKGRAELAGVPQVQLEAGIEDLRRAISMCVLMSKVMRLGCWGCCGAVHCINTMRILWTVSVPVVRRVSVLICICLCVMSRAPTMVIFGGGVAGECELY